MKLVKINKEYYLLDGKIKDGDKVLHEQDILTVNKNKGAYLSTHQFPNIDIRTDLCKKIIGSSNMDFGTEIPLLNKSKVEILLANSKKKHDRFFTLEEITSDLIVSNLCLSYRHDYGLMSKEEQQKLRFECKEWLRALVNNQDLLNKELSSWDVEIETEILCTNCGQENCDRLQCRGSKDIPYPKLTNGFITITKINQ